MYKGPPFDFLKLTTNHKKMVNCARFSPDDKVAVCVSSDKNISVIDGKTGELVCILDIPKKDKHTGSIYSLAWNADGTQFATAAADKTIRVWEFSCKEGEEIIVKVKKRKTKVTPIESAVVKLVKTYTIGDELADQQLSVCWEGDTIISLSLAGDLNYINTKKEDVYQHVVGHKSEVVGIAVNPKTAQVYSWDHSGTVIERDMSQQNGAGRRYKGDGHGTKHSAVGVRMAVLNNDCTNLITVGRDDTVMSTPVDDLKLKNDKKTKIDGACRFLCAGAKTKELLVLGTHKKIIYVMNGLEIVTTLEKIGYEPTCGALSADEKTLVLGGETDSKKFRLYRYKLDGNKIELVDKIDTKEGYKISHIAFHGDNKQIAVVFENSEIRIYDTTALDKGYNNDIGTLKYHSGDVRGIH
eukprot:UN26795